MTREDHLVSLSSCERCPRMQRPAVVGRHTASRVLLVGQAPGPKEPALGRVAKGLLGPGMAEQGRREAPPH